MNIISFVIISVVLGLLNGFLGRNPNKKYRVYTVSGYCIFIGGLVFLWLMFTSPSKYPLGLWDYLTFPGILIILGILIIIASHFKLDEKDKSHKLW
ncbi:MAG: hypothetical protein RLZZ347_264 [Candidatus Parcubacteria bacterium]|jgi:LytS/YehU family sensor histidine kinase